MDRDGTAGLAISEKMRAQITGLDAAQKNLKDGISPVKTAEGAMQEIQDILNRLDYLATQNRLEHTQNNLSVIAENIQATPQLAKRPEIEVKPFIYTGNKRAAPAPPRTLCAVFCPPEKWNFFRSFPKLLQPAFRHKAENIVDTIFCQTTAGRAGSSEGRSLAADISI